MGEEADEAHRTLPLAIVVACAVLASPCVVAVQVSAETLKSVATPDKRMSE